MTKGEHRIAHLKESSENSSPEAHSNLVADPMNTAFIGDIALEQLVEQEANGTQMPPNGAHPPFPGPQALGDSSELKPAPESTLEETIKKWGLSSLLSRGRTGSIPSNLDTSSVSTAPTTMTTTKGGWFGKGRSRRSSRASSADMVLSNNILSEEPPKPSDTTPIVGGLPLIEVSLPGVEAAAEAEDTNDIYSISTQENGGTSLQRGISVSAPVSTHVTPVIDPLLPPVSGNKKGTHRRHRSLLVSLGWSKASRSTASNTSNSGDLDTLEDNTNGDRSNGSTSGLAAGGLDGDGCGDGRNDNLAPSGSLIDIELLEVELPPSVPFATRGMSNMGNSCFLNAALQCLRHTPGLPTILVPGLHEKAEQKAKEQLEARTQAAVAEVETETEAKKSREKDQEAVKVGKQEESAPKETVAALAKIARATTTTAVMTSMTGGREEAETALLNGLTNDRNEDPTRVAADTTEESAIALQEQELENTAAAAAPPPSPPLSGAAVPVAPPPAPLPRPSQGELASSIATLFTELFLNPVTTAANGSSSSSLISPAVSPLTLLSVLRRFPTASDYFDGRQQDCQEVLQILLDLLHEDLNRVEPMKKKKEEDSEEDIDQEKKVGEKEHQPKKNEGGRIKDTVQAMRSASTGLPPRPPTPFTSPSVAPLALPPPPPPPPPLSLLKVSTTDESIKADNAWSSWRRTADSPISDIFMGQLQSSVTCSKCGGRFTMYEPFWELSLPLAPNSGGAFSWLTFKPGGSSLSLQDCLRAYTAGEKLDGKEAFSCEKCGEKTPATKQLCLHRLPDALILHVKRFKHGGAGGGGDKLTTDVVFPLHSLDLSNHLSPESPHPLQECLYDLYAISYHTGSLAGGHYLACCRLSKEGKEGMTTTHDSSWYLFNDETVTPVAEGNVKTQNAYILFYARRKFKDPSAAAAAFALRAAAKQGGSSGGSGSGHHHRRSASSGGSGSGGGGFLFGNRSKEKAVAVAASKEKRDESC
ncbi:hypothetical protein Ndes2526B_g05900 [Nannochloris sp. 'desiccata']|nr:hypothetical protein KSW81_007712 [Chlorella desiccata (nom. nud.)]